MVTAAAAVHALVEAFGASFGPSTAAPKYDVRFDGPRIVLSTDCGNLVERASEWKRLCGRLWAQTLAPARADAIVAILPTLCEFDGAAWAPMSRLVESKSVASALRALESSLRAKHEIEALCCRHSADFTAWGYSTATFKTGKVRRTIDKALKEKKALPAMPLVKLPLEHIDDADPLERLRALVWVREAMSESPANLLGIHRLLVRHVFPLMSDGEGLWREGALAIAERWVRRLVVRGAHVEALPLLDALIAYGVGTPKLLATRYEAQLSLNEPAAAEETLARLRAIADESGHIRFPLAHVDQHVADMTALALSAAAKHFRQWSTGTHPFAEKRLKNEPPPAEVSRKDAAKLARHYARSALVIFEARSKQAVTLKYPVNYAFYIDRTKKLLA